MFSRDFRLLRLGQTTSQFGSQISGMAIPLLAVLTLHASALQVGLINASATVGFALVGLPAGAILDRCHRRRILIVSDVARALLLASIPVAGWLGGLSVVQLLVISFLSGIARVFFDIGYRSYLPSVIGPDRVLTGNSALEFIRSSGQVAGPGIGGALVSAIGAASVVFIDALTFAVSAVTLAAISAAERPIRREKARIREGVAFVVRNRALRWLAVASALTNVSFAIASAVNMIYLSRVLDLSAAGIGLVIAAGSAVAMAGAAVTPWLSRRLGSARIVWLSLAVPVPLTVLVLFARPGALVLLLVVGIAAGEFGQMVYAITSVSLRQRICPATMLGRVNATMSVAIMGLFPVGALTGGALGDLIGARLTLAVAGAFSLACPFLVHMALGNVRDVDELPATRE